MRISVLFLPLLLLCGSCSLFSSDSDAQFAQPNSLMADEIEDRVQQIPFQHRDELLQNLLWLTQTGETTIPALLRGLKHASPKVRSSSAWALGRIHDRRTIPHLIAVAKDSNDTVRLEVARSLVVLGDLKNAPTLIEGLDSDKKEVRYLCHEALKAATGRDFGFDHLSDHEAQRRMAVLGWRQWWGEYAGDSFFASSYANRFQLGQPAQPMGEVQRQDQDPLYQDPMDGSQVEPMDPAHDGADVVRPQSGDQPVVPGQEPATDPWQNQPTGEEPQGQPNGEQPIKPAPIEPGEEPPVEPGVEPIVEPIVEPVGGQPESGTEPMPLPDNGDGMRPIGG